MLKIDIGGSKNKIDVNKTWKIMDIYEKADYIYDISSKERFPLENNSVNAFYSSHTFEHTCYDNVDFLIKEIYRTLKPNGKFRLVVPDYDIAIKYYLEKKSFPSNFPSGGDDKYPITRLYAFGNSPDKFMTSSGKKVNYNIAGSKYIAENNLKFLSSGHKSIFNFEYLYSKLKENNFKDIKKLSYNNCDSLFNNKETGYYIRYSNCSIYLESTK